MQLLTIIEVSRLLGVNEKAARAICKTLPSITVGKRPRYSIDAVSAYLAQLEQPPVNPQCPERRA